MIIKPEIVTTPDHPIVFVREPAEVVDLKKLLDETLYRQGWGLGTKFSLHFVDHDRTRVLATADFLVSEEREEHRTMDVSPDQTMSKTVQVRKWLQLGPWRTLDAATPVGGEPVVKWNVGARKHEVLVNGEVVSAYDDKAAAEAAAESLKAA